MSEYTDDLANEIRRVDGAHSLGAGALAEALGPWMAEHGRQVAEKAWNRAFTAAMDCTGECWFPAWDEVENPYRKEARS